MAETSTAAVLHLIAERMSIVDSSSSDSNDSTMPSPSSAATSFELPSKNRENQAAPEDQTANVTQSDQILQAESTSTPLSFLSLPSDIHHLILTEYLPYDSIVALRSTSHHFHSLISPATLKRLRQNVISNLFASERALLEKWLPQPFGRYSGRPTSHLTCYSCLQVLPTTSFFLDQVSRSRGLGRRRATERWCKACGIKYGKIPHGKWIAEVSYSMDEQLRYEKVMGEELKVKNPCMTCPARHRYDGQYVWWGCVDCFEKEGRRLRKEDSQRRRDVRRHCRSVKQGIQTFVEPDNLREVSHEVWWWMRARFGWGAMVRRGYNFYWWVKDERPVWRVCNTCRRVGRRIPEIGERLGSTARRAVGAVFDKQKDGVRSETAVAVQDCIICSAAPPTTTTAAAPPISVTDADPTPSPSSSHHLNHDHQCLPSPRREVRCWRCWRPKRSRRLRRYDDGLTYGVSLAKEQWCDGCVVEHETFVRAKRGVGIGTVVEGGEVSLERGEVKEEEGEGDVGFLGLDVLFEGESTGPVLTSE